MSTAKRGLGASKIGRGATTVRAGLLERIEAAESGGESRDADPRTIRPNPFQPRRTFDEEALAELAASIREQGLLQPLLVRQTKDGLQLLAGERRQRAAIAAGMERVPVRVLANVSDTRARAISLTENLAREDLSAWEEAHGIAGLRDALQEEDGHALSQRDLAAATGRNLRTVNESLRIVERLTPEVLERAGVSVSNVNALPHSSLIGAARVDDIVERARLLALAVGAEAPGRAVEEAQRKSKPRKGRPVKPYSLVVHRKGARTGQVSFSIKRPEDITPGTAREILEGLEPILDALRKRLDEEER